jgi:peptidoglycan lytic transglycosylase G
VRTLFKFVAALAVIALAFALWFTWAALLPVTPPQTTFVLLRPGWSTRHIAQTLQRQGIIRSSSAFLMLQYAEGVKSLKAGEYKFEEPATALDVWRRLARGDVYARTVVVPEGYNIYDIAAAVEQAGLGPAADFVAAAKGDTSLVRDFDPGAKSLEGYLFPDTYQFTRIDNAHDMAAAMVRRFRQEAQKIGLQGNPDLPRIVTMASIVEKETAVPEERPLVAGVYSNRLAKNMALAADPSVIYAALLAGRYRGTIYQSDLQFESPYNTYRYAGLPPGPIANPGVASLEAALHPAHTDFLYFVSDNNGHHRFARSPEEHARNVASYRRAVAASQ